MTLLFLLLDAKKNRKVVHIAQNKKQKFVKIFIKFFIFFLKKYCIFKYFNV